MGLPAREAWAPHVTLLPAEDALLVLVDCQPGTLGMVRTMQEAALEAALARVAAALGMPVILAAAPVPGSAGEVAPELALVAAGASHIARHRTSVWEEPAFRDALAESGRNTVVFAGIRTVVAVAIAALAARGAGHFCARRLS